MIQSLTYRKSAINDLEQIVNLLLEDELGQTRESKKPVKVRDGIIVK